MKYYIKKWIHFDLDAEHFSQWAIKSNTGKILAYVGGNAGSECRWWLTASPLRTPPHKVARSFVDACNQAEQAIERLGYVGLTEEQANLI